MMMMTGRVLLVCALCMLWCGACSGGRAETTSPVPSGSSPDEITKNEKGAIGGAGGGVKNGKQEAPQASPSKASGSQGAAPDPSQTPPGGEASGTPSADAGTDNKDQETEGEKKDDEDEEEEEVEEDEEYEDEEREEKEEDGTKGTEKTMKGADTGTAEGISAGGQKQPSLSSAAATASNITNPNSTQTTGDSDPAADAAGTAEEKQNENKDANPKETP
ncbi:mucin-associated surface protein (MASP), putative, partial [Trypanosoma cruzi]